MRNPNSRKTAAAATALGSTLYHSSARLLLNDLTRLLRLLGISARFEIFDVQESSVSSRTRGHRVAYAFAIGEILSYWHQDAAYLDNTGRPRALKVTGQGATFQRLVAQAHLNAQAGEVLRALRRTKAVEFLADGTVRPTRRTLTVFTDRDLAIHHTFVTLKGILRRR